MRRFVLLVAVLSLVGCQANPETGRLNTGTEAITYNERLAEVPAKLVEKPADEWAGGWVNTGTRVVVVSDETKEPEKFPGSRLVKVNIKDGERAGEVLLIDRIDLRPVPK